MARYLSKSVALLVVLCFAVAGCALPQTAKEHPTATGAAAGGILGGAIGATAGGLIGGDTKSAIIGGVAGAALGALAGGMIGHYSAKRTKSAEETAKAEGYKAPATSGGATSTSGGATSGGAKAVPASATTGQGTVVKLKAIEIEPAEVGPGETVKINFLYALLTPNPNAKTPVEEQRAITFKGEEIGTVTFTKEHTAGTWKTTVPLAMPSQAEPGTYVVSGLVKAGEQEAANSVTFVVKK